MASNDDYCGNCSSISYTFTETGCDTYQLHEGCADNQACSGVIRVIGGAVLTVQRPTALPTTFPTLQPSNSPTLYPTAAPTIQVDVNYIISLNLLKVSSILTFFFFFFFFSFML